MDLETQFENSQLENTILAQQFFFFLHIPRVTVHVYVMYARVLPETTQGVKEDPGS